MDVRFKLDTNLSVVVQIAQNRIENPLQKFISNDLLIAVDNFGYKLVLDSEHV